MVPKAEKKQGNQWLMTVSGSVVTGKNGNRAVLLEVTQNSLSFSAALNPQLARIVAERLLSGADKIDQEAVDGVVASVKGEGL